ncbi:COP1-interactive protein 1-like [Zingiber officinale]|uniref:COP1-interactive protein 1-like n=1 Tax=Zingiber officinale TaxID=94328 RepID=UPI001C4BAF2A|nr:COP1-interactive protein 1-like [Zingiber officinale]
MKTNKFSKFISSIKTHIHHGNNEKLENKKETENKVDRLLQLIENGTISMNSVNKSELTTLIEDIHKSYQAIYGHYDELTEYLKKKFHKKGDNSGISSNFSTYSESSDSSDSELVGFKNNSIESDEEQEDYSAVKERLESMSRRYDELKREFTLTTVRLEQFEGFQPQLLKALDMNKDLEQKLEASLEQKQELNQRMNTMHYQIQCLESEKTEILQKLQESEKYIEGYICEINQMKNKLMTMESDGNRLKQESEEKSKEMTNVREYCVLEKEIEALILLSKMQEDKTLADQRDEAIQNLKVSNDELCAKITQLLSENKTLNHDLDAADKNGHELTSRLEGVEEEIKASKSEIIDLKTKLKISNNDIAHLLSGIESLDRQLESKNAENENLALKHREAATSAEEEHDKVEVLQKEIEEVKDEISHAYGAYKLELQSKQQSEHNLLMDTNTTTIEKLVLVEENKELLAKVKISENLIEGLKAQRKRCEILVSDFEVKTQNLEIELKSANLQLTEAKKKHKTNSKQITNLTMKNTKLLDEKYSLHIHISELKKQLTWSRNFNTESINNFSEQSLSLLNKLDDTVKQKFLEQENHLITLKDGLKSLHTLSKQLNHQFHESCQKLDHAEAVSQEQAREIYKQEVKIEELQKTLELCEVEKEAASREMACLKIQLDLAETASQEQVIQINKLTAKVDDLLQNLKLSEAEKSETSKEITCLKNQVESQQCLFNQNLKTMEAEYAEKQASLECSIQLLRHEVAILNTQLKESRHEVFKAVQIGTMEVSEFCRELNMLESQVKQEHFDRFTQLSSLTSEARNLLLQVRQLMNAKHEMNLEIQDMAQRLKNSEETIAAFKRKAEEMKAQLAETEKEMGNVVTKSIELDRRIDELERCVKEKDEEITSRKMEKLEAINQLSIMIDYQQEKYRQLSDYVLSLKSARRLVGFE